MEETLRLQLLCVAGLFEATTGMSLASIGKKALNDNTVFNRLRDRGVTFNVRTFDRLLDWLNLNWPEGVEWPVEITRPTPPEPTP